MSVDIYANPPATRGKRLPCLSPLTGTVQDASSSSLLDKSYKELQQARAFTPPGNNHVHMPRPPTSQVDSLSSAAARHLNHLGRAPSSPYQRLMTPEEQHQLRNQVVSHLKKMAVEFRESQAGAATTSGEGGSHSNGGGAPPSQPRPHSCGAYPHPPTTSRPSTSVPVSELQMPLPGQRVERRMSTSLLEDARVDEVWPEGHDKQHPTSASRLGTPSRLSRSFRVRLRQSGPAPPLTPTRIADVLRSSGISGGPLSPGPAGAATAAGQPRSSSLDRRTASAPRSAIGTKAANCGGPVEEVTPTRGTMYAVFTEMDAFDTGKVTLSAFEDAAYKVGMRAEQAQRFFSNLDPSARGYITMKDWGAREKETHVLNFTRLYVKQVHRNKRMQEAASLPMALEMAMYKLQLKNNGRTVNSRRIKEAFAFIDTDNNGSLDREELADAFSALGINVDPKLVDSTLTMFDINHSGTVDYDEFLRTLYPTLSKGVYNQIKSQYDDL